ncbi:clan AA aspartic protease [Myroides odoratus]|uniref:clan AA aspartic protease n=1 Tax=Myroides odoratus TaxID=256 RepID=UPI000765AE8C|nr:clan AA aspartic protease [Myroides odoratus]
MKHLFSLLFLGYFGMQAVAQTNNTNDTIPFILNKHNTLYVKAIVNEIDTLNLNFDTGSSELTLTHHTLEHKFKSTVNLYHTLYKVKIGSQTYQTRLYDAALAGNDTDGRFGWDLFNGQVVEVNYDQNILVVHHQLPDYVTKDPAYTKLVINYVDNVFLVQSSIMHHEVENKDAFLFDTGFNRTVMLDTDLMKENHFPFDQMEVIKTSIMRGATGNEIPVITANLQQLKLGDYCLKNIPAQQLTSHKPIQNKNIHILGNEVLKRFTTFMDFKDHIIYLKPNGLYDVAYTDAK